MVIIEVYEIQTIKILRSKNIHQPQTIFYKTLINKYLTLIQGLCTAPCLLIGLILTHIPQSLWHTLKINYKKTSIKLMNEVK